MNLIQDVGFLLALTSIHIFSAWGASIYFSYILIEYLIIRYKADDKVIDEFCQYANHHRYEVVHFPTHEMMLRNRSRKNLFWDTIWGTFIYGIWVVPFLIISLAPVGFDDLGSLMLKLLTLIHLIPIYTLLRYRAIFLRQLAKFRAMPKVEVTNEDYRLDKHRKPSKNRRK